MIKYISRIFISKLAHCKKYTCRTVLNMDPPRPPPGLGSLSQAQPPSKDATPAVIGHQTT